MQIGEIRGLDMTLRDTLQYKFTTTLLTPKDVDPLIDMLLDKSGGEEGLRRNAICYVRAVKRDDLTDMIAVDYILPAQCHRALFCWRY
jgi:hypothetical protein